MASIFRKPGGEIWWATYYHDGKRFRHSLRTRDERVARRKLKKLEGDLVTGELEKKTTTPLGPFLEQFCAQLETVRTRKSYKNDISYLRTFFGPVCEALEPRSTVNHRFPGQRSLKVADRLAHRHVQVRTLEQLTAGKIDDFLATRIREDGISAKTANRFREVLHVMFNYAIRQHGFRSPDRRFPNPVDAVPRRRVDDPQIRFLSLSEIGEQLETLKDCPVIQVMVATYIYAGLRREEVLWLTARDVDLEGGMIRVCKKTVDGETWRPKTRRNRRVAISSALRGYLESFKRPTGCVWYFPSPRGKRWDPDNFSQMLREINRAAGLAWSCLDFRHTFGSHLARKGESLFKISELMGNSPEICRRHYAALVPEEMRDTVEFGPQLRVIRCDGTAQESA